MDNIVTAVCTICKITFYETDEWWQDDCNTCKQPVCKKHRIPIDEDDTYDCTVNCLRCASCQRCSAKPAFGCKLCRVGFCEKHLTDKCKRGNREHFIDDEHKT